MKTVKCSHRCPKRKNLRKLTVEITLSCLADTKKKRKCYILPITNFIIDLFYMLRFNLYYITYIRLDMYIKIIFVKYSLLPLRFNFFSLVHVSNTVYVVCLSSVVRF